MGEKSALHTITNPSVRFIFWAFAFLPVICTFVALGPQEFARVVNVLCTVDNDIVPSSIVKNVDGYVVVDKLYIHQGTPYIIADSPSVFDDAQDIIDAGCDMIDDRIHLSECIPRPGALQIISFEGAKSKFGWFIHKVPGVAFISTPQSLPSTSDLPTVLSGLWHTYASISPSTSSESYTPPRKLLIPSISDSSAPYVSSLYQANSGLNTSFLSVETEQKWSEWAETNDPRRIERAVVAYRH